MIWLSIEKIYFKVDHVSNLSLNILSRKCIINVFNNGSGDILKCTNCLMETPVSQQQTRLTILKRWNKMSITAIVRSAKLANGIKMQRPEGDVQIYIFPYNQQ